MPIRIRMLPRGRRPWQRPQKIETKVFAAGKKPEEKMWKRSSSLTPELLGLGTLFTSAMYTASRGLAISLG
jgi:hypothetical protein